MTPQEWEGQNGPIRIMEAERQATEEEAFELFRLLVATLRSQQLSKEADS